MTTLELILGIGGLLALVTLVGIWIIKVNAWIKQLDTDILEF